jgi:hypothetical protein
VRHIAGWYAQKHPDEDFAETFAIWLTPKSGWRQKYKGWEALEKLKWVDQIARRFRDVEPLRARGQTDITAEEMETTVREFYERSLTQEMSSLDLALDTDLPDVFNVSKRRKKGVNPAAELLHDNRKAIVDKVAYWSGAQRPVVKKLIESIEAKAAEMGLLADTKLQNQHLVEITVYATALAMNYVSRGKFVLP